MKSPLVCFNMIPNPEVVNGTLNNTFQQLTNLCSQSVFFLVPTSYVENSCLPHAVFLHVDFCGDDVHWLLSTETLFRTPGPALQSERLSAKLCLIRTGVLSQAHEKCQLRCESKRNRHVTTKTVARRWSHSRCCDLAALR